MNKIILVSLLTSSLFFNAACTEEQKSAALIGGAIAIGVGIIAADAHNWDDNDRKGHDYDNDCHDGRGDGRHDGRGGDYGRGGGGYDGHRGYALTTTTLSNEGIKLNVQGAKSGATAFADRFKVTPAAAVKIQKAFADVKTQGVESFATIGLSKKDLTAIASKELPDSSAIKSMAGKLDISEAQSRDLIKDLIQEVEAQAANVNSPLWQACIAKGKWRTPENLYCKKASWNACSPETGATLCY